MAKITVTFEVDTSQLFDAIAAMKGNCCPLGERIVGIMLTGECPWRDEIGIAAYGVTLVPKNCGGA